VLPERSSRHHAKVIVCDLDWALVTSCNFLNAPPSRSVDEVGVYVTAARHAASSILSDERPAPARAVIDVLDWTRRVLPQYELRRHVQSTPVLFGRRDIAAEFSIGEPVTLPANDSARGFWKDAWTRRSAYYWSLLKETKCMGVPICDDENRRLLLHALESCQQRLLIASPELGRGILGALPARAIADKRSCNVAIGIYYQQWAPGADMNTDYRSRRTELEQAGVRFACINSHAKLLICDDWAIVGSFNFLSFQGGGRSELGLRILAKDLVDELAGHLNKLAGGA
jgi:hypothetical protein